MGKTNVAKSGHPRRSKWATHPPACLPCAARALPGAHYIIYRRGSEKLVGGIGGRDSGTRGRRCELPSVPKHDPIDRARQPPAGGRALRELNEASSPNHDSSRRCHHSISVAAPHDDGVGGRRTRTATGARQKGEVPTVPQVRQGASSRRTTGTSVQSV